MLAGQKTGFTDEELRAASRGRAARDPGALHLQDLHQERRARRHLRRHWRRMNVHHASLFPDLIGASTTATSSLPRLSRRAEIVRQGGWRRRERASTRR